MLTARSPAREPRDGKHADGQRAAPQQEQAPVQRDGDPHQRRELKDVPQAVGHALGERALHVAEVVREAGEDLAGVAALEERQRQLQELAVQRFLKVAHGPQAQLRHLAGLQRGEAGAAGRHHQQRERERTSQARRWLGPQKVSQRTADPGGRGAAGGCAGREDELQGGADQDGEQARRRRGSRHPHHGERERSRAPEQQAPQTQVRGGHRG